MKLATLTEILVECERVFPEPVAHILIDQLRGASDTTEIRDKELERELRRLLKQIDITLKSSHLTLDQRLQFRQLRRTIKDALYK